MNGCEEVKCPFQNGHFTSLRTTLVYIIKNRNLVIDVYNVNLFVTVYTMLNLSVHEGRYI